MFSPSRSTRQVQDLKERIIKVSISSMHISLQLSEILRKQRMFAREGNLTIPTQQPHFYAGSYIRYLFPREQIKRKTQSQFCNERNHLARKAKWPVLGFDT